MKRPMDKIFVKPKRAASKIFFVKRLRHRQKILKKMGGGKIF